MYIFTKQHNLENVRNTARNVIFILNIKVSAQPFYIFSEVNALIMTLRCICVLLFLL